MTSQDTITPENARSLKDVSMVRLKCQQVFLIAQRDRLLFWRLNPPALDSIVDFCCDLISRDFGTDYKSIPPHGRWRHFSVNGRDRIDALINQWSSQESIDQLEIGRRLVDLFLVSVLMDAGAGTEWSFTEPDQGPEENGTQSIGRSEGLAVGTLHAFKTGLFSSDPQSPYQADSIGLESMTADKVAEFMQSKPGNQMVGLEGRASLLKSLGNLLSSKLTSKFFINQASGAPIRPGNMIDYLMSHPDPDVIPVPKAMMTGEIIVPIRILWDIIAISDEGLASIWPKEGRQPIGGQFLGDVWICESLGAYNGRAEGQVPFHKLSQWLVYSLIEIFEKVLGWKITDQHHLTGLPEYRNGGLLIDFDYLRPIPSEFIKSLSLTNITPDKFNLLDSLPPLKPSHQSIIEWRAVTVACLDQIHEAINARLSGVTKNRVNGYLNVEPILTLPQVLEAATWKAGREIAQIKRPHLSGCPPIKVESDGTIF